MMMTFPNTVPLALSHEPEGKLLLSAVQNLQRPQSASTLHSSSLCPTAPELCLPVIHVEALQSRCCVSWRSPVAFVLLHTLDKHSSCPHSYAWLQELELLNFQGPGVKALVSHAQSCCPRLVSLVLSHCTLHQAAWFAVQRLCPQLLVPLPPVSSHSEGFVCQLATCWPQGVPAADTSTRPCAAVGDSLARVLKRAGMLQPPAVRLHQSPRIRAK